MIETQWFICKYP